MLLKYQLYFLICLFCGFALCNSTADALTLKSDTVSRNSKSEKSKTFEEIDNSPGREWNEKDKNNVKLIVKNKDYWDNFRKNITNYWDNWRKNNTEYWDNFRKNLRDNLNKNDKEEETTKETTTKIDGFVCPSMQGRYPHPEDCSKFFKCSNFMAATKTCPERKLFDGIQMRCRRENKVKCGSREKLTTTLLTTSKVFTEKSTTISLTTTEHPTTKEIQPITTETTVEPTSTQEHTTLQTTTEAPTHTTTIQSTITTKEPTTFQSTTTEISKPTGPPKTNCPEEDLDCIIKETGEISLWFTCPEAMGSFIHPSSIKLFVYCRNGKPKVKKCGQNRIFSIGKKTCVLS